MMKSNGNLEYKSNCYHVKVIMGELGGESRGYNGCHWLGAVLTWVRCSTNLMSLFRCSTILVSLVRCSTNLVRVQY